MFERARVTDLADRVDAMVGTELDSPVARGIDCDGHESIASHRGPEVGNNVDPAIPERESWSSPRPLDSPTPNSSGWRTTSTSLPTQSAPFAEKTGRARVSRSGGSGANGSLDRFRQANEQTRDTWIVSSEHMSSWLTHRRSGRRPLSDVRSRRYRPYRCPAVRPQAGLHGGRIARGMGEDGQSRQFDVELHIRMSVRYDFAALIDRWRGGPLVNRVTVCLFPDFAHMPTLINGFCDAIGIPAYTLDEPRMNGSLSARCVERLRRVNAASGRWRPEVVDAPRHRVVRDRGTDRYALSLGRRPADHERLSCTPTPERSHRCQRGEGWTTHST